MPDTLTRSLPANQRTAATWLRRLTTTDDGIAALVLRLTLAAVMFPHGAQKVLGWFGGPGFSGEVAFLTDVMGLPYVIALLVILIEFFAPLALALGFFSRVAAFGVGCVMVGAVFTAHLPFGFFMNWTDAQAGEGFEYHLLALGIVVALLIKGSGAFSLDRTLFERSA